MEPTLANARRLRAALADFGFGESLPPAKDLAAADKVFMVGRKPNRIDILTGIDGVSFPAAWASRVEAKFEASPLFVIGREALLVNKRASGRRKDLLDIAVLEAHSTRTTTKSARKPVKTRGAKRR